MVDHNGNLFISNIYIKLSISKNLYTELDSQTKYPEMKENGEFFKFPISNQGLQWFSSIDEMRLTYQKQFQKLYGSNEDIRHFSVSVSHRNSLNNLSKKMSVKYKRTVLESWAIHCDVCTNGIVYCRFQKSKGFHLTSINYYHIHTNNRQNYMKYMSHNENFAQYFTDYFMDIKKGDRYFFSEQSREDKLLEFIGSLHSGIRMLKDTTKFFIMKKNFGVSEEEFKVLMKKFNQNFDSSFRQLIQKLDRQNTTYRFLPSNLLKEKNLEENNESDHTYHPQEKFDSENPTLPNILLIVTPAMKNHFLKFGSLVGFDLTFSIIRERTADNGQYMVGCFLGTTESKRIIIYGLTVTNSQSVFAYSWIFQQFFKIMGTSPQVIVTDEEKAIHFALKDLKKSGIFKGQHLFDVFHILRKFRIRGYSGDIFQSIRKMIHAKDKLSYRKMFRNALLQVSNDKQRDLLRNFDLHSQRYCYSQIEPFFVGIGVSNSPNEYFHSHIKQQLPYAISYTKAVQKILSIIEFREPLVKIPVLIPTPYYENIKLEHMKIMKNSISDKAFGYIMKETCKCPYQKVLPSWQIVKRNLQNSKDPNQNELYVQDKNGTYLVFIPKTKDSFDGAQWYCLCGFRQKSGYLCSHIAKVMLYKGINFMENIDKRWKVSLQIFQNTYFDAFKTVMKQKTINKIYLEPTNEKIRKYTSQQPEKIQMDKMHTKSRDRLLWVRRQQIQYINFLFHNIHLFQDQKKVNSDVFETMSHYFENKDKSECMRHHNFMLLKYDSVQNIISFHQSILKPRISPVSKKKKYSEGSNNQNLTSNAVESSQMKRDEGEEEESLNEGENVRRIAKKVKTRKRRGA